MKEKILNINKIFYNILIAIIIMAYFFSVNIVYGRVETNQLERYIQMFSGFFMLIGVFFLEKAYKKDDTSKVIMAVEFLFLSTYSLSITYIIKKYGFDIQLYLTTTSYIFAIYYTLKSIITYTKEKKQILDSFCDIKEIVKKEEPIKKEATKRKKEQKYNKQEETKKVIEKDKKKKSSKKGIQKTVKSK